MTLPSDSDPSAPKGASLPVTPAKDQAQSSDANDALAIREVVEHELSSIVQDDEQRAAVVEKVSSVFELFRGPMPHPEHLKQYEEICPGSADRILAMAERQQQFVHGETKESRIDLNADAMRGMRFGFASLVVMLSAVIGCAYMDKPYVAAGILGLGVLGIVGIFVRGRFRD